MVAASNTSRNGPWEPLARAVRAISKDVATHGVSASSAGFGDAKPRSRVTFAVYATAGSDDFHYLEMRALDAKLTTPHTLTVFQDGHTLPPPEVAADAIEWLELQAMRQDRRARDGAPIARWHASRRARVAAAPDETICSCRTPRDRSCAGCPRRTRGPRVIVPA